MKKLLFHIARCKPMGLIVGLVFAYFPSIIPVKKIMQNKKAVSFMHPSSVYPDHVLIIPRKIARNVFSLSAGDFLEIIEMAIKIHNDNDRDFVLLINGGKRQDVMQAHFHLFTGNVALQKGLLKEKGTTCKLSDQSFWEQIVLNLHDLLKQAGVSEKCFTMFIQFQKCAEPSIYFI